MSGPKTLAERLEWMAANLPGFREELDEVAAIQRSRDTLVVPLATPLINVAALQKSCVEAENSL